MQNNIFFDKISFKNNLKIKKGTVVFMDLQQFLF